MESDKLVQPGAEMFNRNVGHIARRGREVQIWLRGVPEPRVGFVAGLDEQNVQVCLTHNQTLSMVRRDDIVAFDETGMTLGMYARDGLEEDSLRRIREKIDHFQRKAAALYPKAKR